MSRNYKKVLTYFFIINAIFLGLFFVIFYTQANGVSNLELRDFGKIFVSDIVLFLLILSAVESKDQIHDEREQLIEMKAYKTCYLVTALTCTLVPLANILANIFSRKTGTISFDASYLVWILLAVKELSIRHYRKKV